MRIRAYGVVISATVIRKCRVLLKSLYIFDEIEHCFIVCGVSCLWRISKVSERARAINDCSMLNARIRYDCELCFVSAPAETPISKLMST